MKKNTFIYHNGICKLTIYDFTENINYEWLDEKRIFFGLIPWYPEGFRYTWDWDKEVISEEEILLDKNVIIDKIVYIKPRIKFELMNEGEIEYYFDSMDELQKFIINEGLDKIPHTKI